MVSVHENEMGCWLVTTTSGSVRQSRLGSWRSRSHSSASGTCVSRSFLYFFFIIIFGFLDGDGCIYVFYARKYSRFVLLQLFRAGWKALARKARKARKQRPAAIWSVCVAGFGLYVLNTPVCTHIYAFILASIFMHRCLIRVIRVIRCIQIWWTVNLEHFSYAHTKDYVRAPYS